MIALRALLLLPLIATPAPAEIPPGTLDCRAGQTCITSGRCSPAPADAPALVLTLGEDLAEFRSGDEAIAFRRVGGVGTAQTYLAGPWRGSIVLFTIEADLSFVIAAHEKLEAGLSATAGTGTCTRRSG